MAVFSAFIAAMAVAPPIAIPGNPVPITLQLLGVMLSGAVLGWKRGAAAVALMLLVGTLGLPVLPAGRPVLAALQGPTAGYLVGWMAGAAVIGALVQSRLPRLPLWWSVVSCLVGGVLVVYAFGVPVTAARANLSLGQALRLAVTALGSGCPARGGRAAWPAGGSWRVSARCVAGADRAAGAQSVDAVRS